MSAFHETLAEAGEDGPALSNSTTATSLLQPARKFYLPAGFFDKVGRRALIRASGRISTAAAGPGTFTFDVRFTGASTVTVFNGGASGTLATSASNLTWLLELELHARALGSSATVIGTGKLLTAGLSATTPIMLLPASAPAAGTAFDGTVAQLVDLFGTWSVASASNSITLHDYRLTVVY